MKKYFYFFTAISILLAGCSSDDYGSGDDKKTAKDFVGRTFDLDSYHRIEFKTESRYWIYQKPLNCGGDGNWSIQNDKIILGLNDSRCESTSKINGAYEMSNF